MSGRSTGMEEAIMSPKMSLVDAIRHSLATGSALRPADYPKGYYFLLSAPSNVADLHHTRICSPGPRGARPVDLSVAILLGDWVTLPVVDAQNERILELEALVPGKEVGDK